MRGETMVEPGRIAVIHFTGRIAEGESAGKVFDTTDVDVALEEGIYHDHRDYRPLEVRVGEEKILEGVDRALREMDVGEERTVELQPEEAFGPRDEAKVLEVPLERLDEDDVEAGSLVGSETGETGWVLSAEDEVAVVDFNHELASVEIECTLRVLDAYGSPDDAEASDDADTPDGGEA